MRPIRLDRIKLTKSIPYFIPRRIYYIPIWNKPKISIWRDILVRIGPVSFISNKI